MSDIVSEHAAEAHARGLAERAAGRGAAAVACFERALATDPGHRPARIELATSLRELGRLDAAEAAYRTLAADAPGWFFPPLGLGLCARQRGDHEAALTLLAAAVAAAPAEPSALLEYATTLREAGRIAEAEPVYRALLAAAPGAVAGLIGLGICLRLQGAHAPAAEALATALATAPGSRDALVEYATTLREQGRLAEAETAYRQLQAETPGWFFPWLGLGLCARARGDAAAARAAFRAGHAAAPEIQQFLVEMAIEEQTLGEFTAAEAHLRRVTEVAALAPTALTQLGELARIGQALAPALDLFRRAVAMPGAPLGAHLALAQTLADLGDTQAALAALAAAPARPAERPTVAAKHAFLLRQGGDVPAALAVARAAAAAAPNDFALWLEGFECARLVDFDGIAPCLAAAPAASVAEHALLHAAHGAVAAQRWQPEAAARHFAAAAALAPATARLHEALARASLLACDAPAAHRHMLEATRLAAPVRLQQGLSPNPGYTELGQLVDEFLIDAPAMATLASLQALPPAARIARLREQVRAAPDHTPTALALLLALRQSGLLAAGQGRGGEKIPATIAQYWHTAPPPPDVAALMQGWQDTNPGHRTTRFDHPAADRFIAAHYPQAVLVAYRRAREPAMRADLFRLAWLYREGGCFADADDRCLRPLDTWLPPTGFLAHQDEYGALDPTLLAATPGHAVIGTALDLAVTALNRGDEDLRWLATGPGLLTRAFARCLATAAEPPAQWLAGMTILNRHELAANAGCHCTLAYKTTRAARRTAFGRSSEDKNVLF